MMTGRFTRPEPCVRLKKSRNGIPVLRKFREIRVGRRLQARPRGARACVDEGRRHGAAARLSEPEANGFWTPLQPKLAGGCLPPELREIDEITRIKPMALTREAR